RAAAASDGNRTRRGPGKISQRESWVGVQGQLTVNNGRAAGGYGASACSAVHKTSCDFQLGLCFTSIRTSAERKEAYFPSSKLFSWATRAYKIRRVAASRRPRNNYARIQFFMHL